MREAILYKKSPQRRGYASEAGEIPRGFPRYPLLKTHSNQIGEFAGEWRQECAPTLGSDVSEHQSVGCDQR